MRKPHFIIYTLLIIFIVAYACQPEQPYVELYGETMGTYYKITAQKPVKDRLTKNEIDSALIALNKVLSTYDPSSEISKINQFEQVDISISVSDMLWHNLLRASFWYDQSGGYFDPSIMPLVNYWGFGYTEQKEVNQIDSALVDSLNTFIGLEDWTIESSQQSVQKKDFRQQLDLSAIAKGYGVDNLAALLESKGIKNYLIDIGGEMKASGRNSHGAIWTIGISTPTIESRPQDIITIVQLDNRAIASSGNYRNYRRTENGVYGHTINPLSGYPFQDKLLAVSILADNCMDADAIATSCMAMGFDRATKFVDQLENIEACFYSGSTADTITTTFTDGFIRQLFKK